MKTIASLAAALVVAVTAGAASAGDARIRWGDLDLSSAAGADIFDSRIEEAARKLCRNARAPLSLISDKAFCQGAVRSEALRQLPREVRIEYAMSRRSIVI